MSISLVPRRLFGRVALLIIGIALLQFAATILLYDRISRDSVREDHARRVAELLEVSERLHARGEKDLAGLMTTKHLQVWLTSAPAVTDTPPDGAAYQIRELIRQWEPALSVAPLNMQVESGPGRDHLVGSMQLFDGGWLNFRSTDLSSPWPIIASASLITLLLTSLCILFAVLILRQLGAPLRRLADATMRIGEGRGVVLAESGPSDIRNLSRAYNSMQERISRILSDQTKALVAISHDLRTPLSRLRLSSDFIEPKEASVLVEDTVDEMEAMIASLQLFLKAQEVSDQPRETDLEEVIGAAGVRWRDRVRITRNCASATTMTYPVALRLALEPLIENAIQYGDAAQISIDRDKNGLVITIRDGGPGLAEDQFPKLIEPFFRGDLSRGRNTAGFGLGIPTAHRLLQRFGGQLSFSRAEGGGLVAEVRPPRA